MAEPSGLNQISPEHLLTLYQITSSINTSLEFEEVLNMVMDAVMHVTKAQRGVLMMADEAGELHAHVVRGDRDDAENAYSRTIIHEVVRTRQSLLTNNAQFDQRYKPGESIIMRGLRAILCAPMLVKGRLVGVIYCDTSLRHGIFTESDLALLDVVAGQAGIAIENARLYRVAVEKGRLERELQMAREIQESLLPRQMPDLQGYEVAARWRSAREVAGDFYDLFQLDHGSMGMVIADVSDKGAPAALFMASARSVIRSHAFAGFSPLDTLLRTNTLLLQDSEGGMFVTAYHSQFRQGGASLHINAGHNPPFFMQAATGQIQMLPIGGRAIGWFEDNPMRAVELQLTPGDVIVYYTDGLTDAENIYGECYGVERLARVIRESVGLSADGVLAYIVDSVDAFCVDAPVLDDLTLVVIRYTG
ncbi:MAG: GAF domain-containing SpoIIE family protein phosphatase [bacterium]|nr:GAF domain-containing SpoIIE family protein phosphatase [bacterium]